ncbi:MAG: cytochrome c [Candidatus Tectomicrobia bacterium]|nr:cytochrome c [Candidatus Tectomicrobia bacterium]
MFNRYVVAVLATAAAVLSGIISPAEAADVEAGKVLYEQRCAPCHGTDGKANTPTAQALQPPPRDHTDGVYMNGLTDSHLFRVIKDGGPAVGKSPIMPPQFDLKEEQLNNIVAFLRTLAIPPYEGGN